MLMEKKTVYRLNELIPFCELPLNAIITKEGNNYYFHDMVIPFMNNKVASQYCSIETIYVPKYALGTKCLVQLKYSDNPNSFDICTIHEFNGKSGKYTIKYNRRSISDISEDQLKPLEEYYFLSSSGIVQRDYLYRDIETENWRKKVGNFFLDKEACKAYRERLLNGQS